jgi:hypothetical protein
MAKLISNHKTVYIVIFYLILPPSDIEQEKILSKIARKEKTTPILLATKEIRNEDRYSIEGIFASIRATCALLLAQKCIPKMEKQKEWIEKFESFYVRIVSGFQ